MASVYRAYDFRLRRWRAVKVLLPELARRSKLRQRFESEAHAMAMLEHRHIVRVYDVGASEDQAWIVMELCPGGSLEGWVETHGAMPPRLAVQVMLEVCEGIALAHRSGIVHRDIKPQNVLIDQHGSCKVTDFGIAHVEQTDLTRTGSVMGTLGYMAPEQRSNAKSVDARADIYALGATLYNLLTERTTMDLFAAGQDEEILLGIPEPLAEVIKRATEYRPDRRYTSVEALMEALGRAGERLPADPRGTPSLRPAEPPDWPIPEAPPEAAQGGSPTLLPASDPGSTLGAQAPVRETLVPTAGSAATQTWIQEDPNADERLRQIPWVPHAERHGEAQRPREERPARGADDRPSYLADDRPSYLADDRPSYLADDRPSFEGSSPSPLGRTRREDEGHYASTSSSRNWSAEGDRGDAVTMEGAVKSAWSGFTELLVAALDFLANPLRYAIWPAVGFAIILSLTSMNASKRVNGAAQEADSAMRGLTSAVEKDAGLIGDFVDAGAPEGILRARWAAYERAQTEEEKAAAAEALVAVLEEQSVHLESADDPDFDKKRKRLQSRVDALSRRRVQYTEKRQSWADATTGFGAKLAVLIGLADAPPVPAEE